VATVIANPIPAGKYWSDLIGEQGRDRWLGWKANVAGDRIRVVKTVTHDAEGESPFRVWVLWEVLTPVFYDHAFLPPVNSGDNVSGEEDTVTKPDVPDLALPSFGAVGAKIDSLVEIIGIGIGVIGVVAVLATMLRRK